VSATWFLDCTMADGYSNRRAEMAFKLWADGETRKMGKGRVSPESIGPKNQADRGWFFRDECTSRSLHCFG
jgi:ribosome biogenesis protein Nip4